MPADAPIGIIVLKPDPDDATRGKIEFLAVQDPNQPDPRKAKITVKRNRAVTWLVENYIDEDIDVTIGEFDPESPFKKAEYTKDVEDHSESNGPGLEDFRKKIRKDASKRTYEYTISATGDGITIPKLDPVLEVEGDYVAPESK